jgi:hypothetical protein
MTDAVKVPQPLNSGGTRELAVLPREALLEGGQAEFELVDAMRTGRQGRGRRRQAPEAARRAPGGQDGRAEPDSPGESRIRPDAALAADSDGRPGRARDSPGSGHQADRGAGHERHSRRRRHPHRGGQAGRYAAGRLAPPKESGTIRGDLPVSASLSQAWQALKDIQRRATSFPATGSSAEPATGSAEPAAGSSAGASAGDPAAPDSGSAA